MAYNTPSPNVNYYLQGADIIVRNDHKPLAHFLNGKNTNNKVNRWSLELATYNLPFEWISGARNKAADCLSRLVTPTSTSINMSPASSNDGAAFPYQKSYPEHPLAPLQLLTLGTTPQISQEPTTTLKPLTAECLDALLQMQKN